LPSIFSPTVQSRVQLWKHRDRPYQAGRSKHWVKVKNRSHQAMYRVMDALLSSRIFPPASGGLWGVIGVTMFIHP
jgi:hypothetical protein